MSLYFSRKYSTMHARRTISGWGGIFDREYGEKLCWQEPTENEIAVYAEGPRYEESHVLIWKISEP